MLAVEKYNLWINSDCFDEATKAELKLIEQDEREIEERFYKDLEFGTGGLRGIIGAGTNRMNIYTVRKATQGLANVILREGGKDKGAVVAFDSRNMSPEFAEETALCLAANGIKAYIFDSLRPTPELSFALRELGCMAGVVVTASHNPPEYNGYKVYWEDGAQVTYPLDDEIITDVNSITDYASLKTISKDEAIEKGLYNVVGKEIDDRYIEELKKLVLNPDVIKKQGETLKIVYTPLHGTGNIPARRVLDELGFKNVYVVPEQEKPDGNFSTVGYPNPEDKKAFKLALELAEKVDADLVLATDPDADRLGVYAKNEKTGEYVAFTGNMTAIMILEYLLSEKQKKGMLSEDGKIITTIVSGKMSGAVAKHYDKELIEVLTGFKYIGEKIKQFEQTGKGEYLFGYEESYGCLVGTHARDKDAIVAVMSICEVAAFYKEQGISLVKQMDNLFKKYGYYKEGLVNIALKGIDGAKQIAAMMDNLRENPPKSVGGYKVLTFKDYDKETVIDCQTGEKTSTGLPRSNVLYFTLENDAWCCVRPSGTEPKIKFYIGVKGETEEAAQTELKNLTAAFEALAQ